MQQLTLKHHRLVRWCHWINAVLLFMMIWSGLLIYWAYDPYRIRVGAVTLVRFFPQGFYESLNLQSRLAEGLAWHFAVMWLFAANGLVYVVYTSASGEWRNLLPTLSSVREAFSDVVFTVRGRRRAQSNSKFNGAQRIAYTAVVAMATGSLITGLAIWKSVQFAWLTSLLGGYEAARAQHFAFTISYVVFFLIHVLQVARAGWKNLRAMIIGYEVTGTRHQKP